ncbi:chitobiase/beta-hexosaminidase C-terminal domain-containing protein [Verrucomicrobiales bacterium]|nr:chitobiase/beta-hexosaminidase C-terminal domain-containing protein [Verrucomicrobiales bacterium]
MPTPALPNRSPVSGLVPDTQFTINRGFFDEPFKVEISTETPEATILYTTDGTPPSKGNVFTGPIGEKYVGPITIETTTVVRAFAYKSGLGSSNVETQTYLFIDDVIEQKTMRRSITDSVEYGSQMGKALTDLPSISLSVEDPQFVGGGASNTNDVESPTSVEWLNSDGSEGFQIDGGISRFGGYFTNFAKKSFRLYFHKRYGDSKLEISNLPWPRIRSSTRRRV